MRAGQGDGAVWLGLVTTRDGGDVFELVTETQIRIEVFVRAVGPVDGCSAVDTQFDASALSFEDDLRFDFAIGAVADGQKHVDVRCGLDAQKGAVGGLDVISAIQLGLDTDRLENFLTESGVAIEEYQKTNTFSFLEIRKAKAA